MADGKIKRMKGKMFINKTTGEVVFKRTRWGARRYFKADGKACGYPYSKNDVVDADGFLLLLAAIAVDQVAEKADGIA